MFDATRGYEAGLDVRDWSRWRERLRGEPEGVIWALIGPRRFGKTWALRALESRDAEYVELRSRPDALKAKSSKCLLVDEPGLLLKRDCLGFVEQCASLKELGTRVLVAMTPGEWQCLAELDPEERHIKARDRLVMPLLTQEQATSVARNTAWALDLLRQIPTDWQKNPFLLEFLFETAEEYRELRDNPKELLRRVIHTCNRDRFRYAYFVFREGLSNEQQKILRNVARGHEPGEHALLVDCGLIGEGPRIADPILADHFKQPLILHHISDIHFGPKSASGVDAKEGGSHGRRMTRAVGGACVREDYLTYLESLGTSGPNAIVVSGDLVETGQVTQYEAAREFVDRLPHHAGYDLTR